MKFLKESPKYFFRRLIKHLFIIYLLIGTLLYIFQDNLIYINSKYNPDFKNFESILKTSDYNLHYYTVNPDKEKSIIYFGGNAEDVSLNINDFKYKFAEYTIYLMPYRSYGKNTGTPNEENITNDAINLFEEIQNKHKSVSIIGRSLGSGVASNIASVKDIDKLVLITPFDSLSNIAQSKFPIYPVEYMLDTHFHSFLKVNSFKNDTLIIYGSEDKIIPNESTQKLIDSFYQKPKILKLQSNHNNINLNSKYYSEIQDFLR